MNEIQIRKKKMLFVLNMQSTSPHILGAQPGESSFGMNLSPVMARKGSVNAKCEQRARRLHSTFPPLALSLFLHASASSGAPAPPISPKKIW